MGLMITARYTIGIAILAVCIANSIIPAMIGFERLSRLIRKLKAKLEGDA